MADKKAPPPAGDDGHTITYKILFFFLIMLAVSGLLTKIGFDRYLNSVNSKLEAGNLFSDSTDQLTGEKKGFSFGELFSTGKIVLGGSIANKKEVQVRNEPAGQILGLQNKGAIAKVLEGPVAKFNINWWRVDYKDVPDGWVKENDVTSYVGWFSVFNFIPWLFSGLQKILILFGVIAAILIIIVVRKRNDVRALQKKKEALKKEQSGINAEGNFKVEKVEKDELPIPGLPIGEAPAVVDVSNRRWKNIQSLINSHNLNDWKQAIIEADILLDEMLDKMGYHGDSIGDKLKQIEPSDFLTLNQAWEAHKVRNQIAHQGSNYILSRDEAEKVISLYSEVFKEFYFI